MIFFLRMPTGAIYINYCNDENVNKTMNNFRKKYEPAFLSKIAEVKGNQKECEAIYDKFTNFKISKNTHQYTPCDEIIDFINANHVPHPMFRRQEYVKGWESVIGCSSSKGGGDTVEIMMTRKMQADLMMEGARQSVNPCELVREVMGFYLSIRTSLNFGEDPEQKIARFIEYMTKQL